MKVLVFLSFVALCYSQSTQRYVTIKPDGTIRIGGPSGRELDIRKGLLNNRKIEIVIRKSFGPAVKIEIDEPTRSINAFVKKSDSKLDSLWKQYSTLDKDDTQFDILRKLSQNFAGPLNEERFQKLSKDIEQLVQLGLLHPKVFEVFRIFENQTEVISLRQGRRHIIVKADDTIVFVGFSGRQVEVHRNPINPLKIDFEFKNPDQSSKKIQADDRYILISDDVMSRTPAFAPTWQALKQSGERFTAFSVLQHIFRNEEGTVDDQQYKILLENFQNLVEAGLFPQSLFAGFQFVDNQIDVDGVIEEFRSDGVLSSHSYPRYQQVDYPQQYWNLFNKNTRFERYPSGKTGKFESTPWMQNREYNRNPWTTKQPLQDFSVPQQQTFPYQTQEYKFNPWTRYFDVMNQQFPNPQQKLYVPQQWTYPQQFYQPQEYQMLQQQPEVY